MRVCLISRAVAKEVFGQVWDAVEANAFPCPACFGGRLKLDGGASCFC